MENLRKVNYQLIYEVNADPELEKNAEFFQITDEELRESVLDVIRRMRDEGWGSVDGENYSEVGAMLEFFDSNPPAYLVMFFVMKGMTTVVEHFSKRPVRSIPQIFQKLAEMMELDEDEDDN